MITVIVSNFFKSFSIVIVVVLLSGCLSVGPDYKRPEISMPDKWHSGVVDTFDVEKPVISEWWTVFNDKTLNDLILRAQSGSLDLKTAAARIEQANAARGIVSGELLPSLAVGASAEHTRLSKEAVPIMPDGLERTGTMYKGFAGLSWEIDLWGKIRRSVESADATYQSQVEMYRDVLVMLYAQVAETYIEIRTLQQRISIAESSIETQSNTVFIVKKRYEAGLVQELHVHQAELNLAKTKSSLPSLKVSLSRKLNHLSVLVGEHPGSLRKIIKASFVIPSVPDTIAVGLPVELIRQRPDLRRAERGLAAETALIGVAKAELYPTLSLPGSFVLAEPSNAGELFSGTSQMFSFGPSVTWNLFAGGRLRNAVKAQEAGAKASLFEYEKAVLVALEEVESAMAGFKGEKIRQKHLSATVVSAKKSTIQSLVLYKNGLTDFQDVLLAETSLLQQQDALAVSRGESVGNLVRLYKALGGGWVLPKEDD